MDLVYTVRLLLVPFLTVPAFDHDRDLDSLPSPFLFAFVFPRVAPFFEATRFLGDLSE